MAQAYGNTIKTKELWFGTCGPTLHREPVGCEEPHMHLNSSVWRKPQRFPHLDSLQPTDGCFLLGEHVLQAFEDRENRLSFKLPERLHEALRINRPKLIERHEACASLKTTSRTPWVCTSASRHRRDDDCPEVIIQFVGRHDHAWPRLPDFATERGIESNEMDLTAADWWTAYRHSHSSRSN